MKSVAGLRLCANYDVDGIAFLKTLAIFRCGIPATRKSVISTTRFTDN